MQGNECVGAERQELVRSETCRQRVALGAHLLERRTHERAQLLLRERLAGGIHGRVVGRLRYLAEVVRLHLEPVAIRLAAQAHLRPGRELRLEPRLVEPRRLDLPRAVADPCGEDLQSPTAPARGRAEHDALDHRLVLTEEIADRLLLDRALVASRPVPEQVADGAEAELREPPPHRGTDLRQRLDSRGERLGPRSTARPWPGCRRVQAGKADRESDLGE